MLAEDTRLLDRRQKDCVTHCTASSRSMRILLSVPFWAPSVTGAKPRAPMDSCTRTELYYKERRVWETTAFIVSIKQPCSLSQRGTHPHSTRLLTAKTTLRKGPDKEWLRPSVLGIHNKMCQVQETQGGVSPKHSYYHHLHFTDEEARSEVKELCSKTQLSRGVWIQTQAVWLQNLNYH